MSPAVKKNIRRPNRYKKTQSQAQGKTLSPLGALKKIGGLKLPAGSVKKLGSFKGIAISALFLMIASCILVCVGFVFLWAYDWATTSSLFATRHVDVSGNVRLSREMVLHYAGVREGDNSLAVSIGDLERRLRETPWVDSVSVKRFLPDRFVIKVQERMPSFWVRRDGVLYYANERGQAIAQVESENFLSLPTLALEDGMDVAPEWIHHLMQELQGGALPLEVGSIAEISVSRAKGAEIWLEDRSLCLTLAADDWKGNLRRMALTLSDLAKRQELRNVREIQAAHGSVWVQLNSSAASGV